MNELKEGMYVRTNKGYISKIKEFKNHYTKGKRLVDSYSTKEVVENYLLLDGKQCEFIESISYSIPPCYPSDEELEKIKSHIKNVSYNIIDLIEVGDYVNGHPVTLICEDEVHPQNKCLRIYGRGYVWQKGIKSIVTKEQFESMSYKVGE